MQHALLPVYSPLENTPHKAGNGEISITCRNRSCPKCQSTARDRWLVLKKPFDKVEVLQLAVRVLPEL